jgi:hypothetical protein
MSKTTNLNMALISSTDTFSPETLNTNFEYLDKVGVDYVVEQGTKDGWTYRKWNSRRIEMWRTMTRSGVTVNAGSYFNIAVSLPFTLGVNWNGYSQPRPIISVNGGVAEEAQSFISYTHCDSNTLDAWIYTGGADGSKTVYANYYVEGVY